MPMKINSSGKMQNYDPLTGKYTKANIIEAIEAVDFLSTIKKDIRENSRIDHIIRGDFTETNKYISGGHGQDNIDYMNQNGILFTIDFEYNNGVRIGTIHNRKHYINRKHIHTWFPKDWNKEKIIDALCYGMSKYNGEKKDREYFEFKYEGVLITIIFNARQEISTAFPSVKQ